MHIGYLFGTILLATLPNAIFSAQSVQYRLVNNNKEEDNNLKKKPEFFVSYDSKLFDTSSQIRKALRSLMKLNDNDLNAVFHESSLRDEKNRKSPISALFHHASENYLQRLKNLISAERWDDHLSLGTENINEYSTTSSKFDSKSNVNHEVKNYAETLTNYDDKYLLEEMDHLSAYLAKKTKSKGKGSKFSNKRKRHSHHYARKEAYYQYWLKSGTCPKSPEGFERVHCPTPSKNGDWVCVDDQELCDGYSHCPNDEDENPKACLFYKTVHNYLEFFSTAVLTAIRRH